MADIVLVEDEDVLRRYLSGMLRKLDHTVRAAETAEEGLRLIGEGEPDLLLTDHRLPGMSGGELLEQVKRSHPDVAVIVLTAHGTVEDAVAAMRNGASDYLRKPVDRHELSLVIDRCVAGRGLRNELAYYRNRHLSSSAVDGIVGRSPAMETLRELVARLAQRERKEGGGPTVLITGETGTGKGLVARALHSAAPRANSPFVDINCAALPDQLLEAELLGYERGAFTGAATAKPGLFEAAENGTIFLDEIGRMSLDLQAKVLKVVDDRVFRRLGSTRERTMSCSVISASHLDLELAVREGRFLLDLYHRINVFPIKCPPLRERGDDVLLLAEHFLELHASAYGIPTPRLNDPARQALRQYSWPGNVRELSHAMERAAVLGAGATVEPADLGFPLAGDAQRTAAGGPGDKFTVDFNAGPICLDAIDESLIRQAFRFTGGNRKKAAKLLGISTDTLRYRLEKYKIS